MSLPLPPRLRGPLGRRLTAAAARGAFELPVCSDCGRWQYPPREVCGHCLGDALVWRSAPATGTLLAVTLLHHSNEPFFAARLPKRVGLVRLAEGAEAVTHLAGAAEPGDRVTVRALLDRGGEGVLVAHAGDGENDREVRADMQAFSFSPRGRRIAVYAAVPALAGAVGRGLLDAGAASVVYLDTDAGGEDVEETGLRRAVIEDPHDPEAVCAAAGPVDCLILAGLGAGGDAALDAMAGRRGQAAVDAAVRKPLAVAGALRDGLAVTEGVIVSVSSVFGRCHLPAMGLESTVQAMALSAVEGLRAACHATGVRVLTVFAGPYGGPAGLPLPAPTAVRVTHGVVRALEQGLEESAADPVAEDILARWRDEPKVLERELAAIAEGNR